MRYLCVCAFVLAVADGCGPGDSASKRPLFDAAELERTQDRLLDRFELEPYEAKYDEFERSSGWDRHFEPVGVLRLSDDQVVGTVDELVLGETGRILVVDNHAPEVLLFQPDGMFIRRLDPDPCHPGYPFRPMHAGFAPNGEILVVSRSGSSGFLFDRDGTCLHTIDLLAMSPLGVAAGRRGTTYVLSNSPASFEVYGVDRLGETTSIFEGTAFTRLNDRLRPSSSSITLLDDGRLAMIRIQDPLPSLIEPKNGSVERVGEAPEYFRPIEEDMRAGVTVMEGVIEEMRRVGSGKSKASQVFEVAGGILAMFHTNSYETFSESTRGMAVQLIHTSGSVLNEEPIFFRGYLSGSKTGRDGIMLREGTVYRDPDSDMNSNVPLVVYRLRPTGSGSGPK